jgi:F420-dependent oxidoreductase-like protein
MRVPITLDLHITAFNFPEVPPERLFEHLADMATTAEENGFGSVSVMDHLHQIPPMGPQELNMLEGNMALAGIAGRTSKADLGLLVGGVTYRNPALLAKMCTTLDVISGGRAWFGIGAAWFEAEHDAYGFPFPPLKERFEHLEDALRIARAMFTEERATVEGAHHRVDGAYNNPKPVRGDIPILIGGSGERKTLRFVAQYGDGCNVFGDPERFRHLMGVLDRHCEDVGRDPSEITRTTMATVAVTETQEDAGGRRAQEGRGAGGRDAARAG